MTKLFCMTILQIIYSVLFLIFFCFFTMEFFNIVFRGFAPFIATRKKIIDQILAEMSIKEDATIIELGCGGAGFLRAVRQKYPKANLIGVEYSFLPFVIAKIQNAIGGTKIDIRKKNFFNVDVTQADVVYCYLNVGTMEKLEPKLKSECKDGAQIISFTFSLPNTKPEKEFVASKLGEKLYFYKISK